MEGCIALLSGGLDSTVATAMAHADARVHTALTFDYGQRAREREAETARAFCRRHRIEHRVIELPWLKAWTSTALVDRRHSLPQVGVEGLDAGGEARARATWVPNRNGLFIAIAAALAEGLELSSVVAGFNAEEAAAFPDNSQAFLDAANASLGFSTLHRIRVVSPTAPMTKAEIARQFLDLSLDPQLFWCCYEGDEKLCGRCESCSRTLRAFAAVGRPELIRGRFATA